MQAEPRFSYDPVSQGHRVDFPSGRPRVLTIAFTVLWFAGWLFLLVLLALDYLRFRTLNVAGIALLVLAGVPVALALLWVAFGKRESLIVTPFELRIYRWAGPMRLSRSISAATIVGVRALAVPSRLLADFFAAREFYGAGSGSIAMGLLQADDARIMARLRKMVGKNIGILYFGLDMSADPASMLYGRIGGPQELDAMSESF